MKKLKSLLKPTVLALAVAMIGSFASIKESNAMTLTELVLNGSTDNKVTAFYRDDQGNELSFDVNFDPVRDDGDFTFHDPDRDGLYDNVTGLTWQVKY